MRIEINIVNDDGTVVSIGFNQQIVVDKSKSGPWVWSTKFDSDAIRGLTSEQAWATSFLCMTAACERLPVPASHSASIAAAHAWHEHEARWEQIQATKDLAAERRKTSGKFITSHEGDAQHDPKPVT